MSTAVTVAIISAAGAVVGPALGYLIARQSANDRRANTNRDLETLKQLDPATEIARALSKHIDDSIARYIERDRLRDQAIETLGEYFRFYGVLAIAYGLGKWLQIGVPRDFRLGVQILLVGVIAIALWQFADLMISVTRVIVLAVKSLVLRIRLSRKRRQAKKLEAAVLHLREQLAAARDWTAQTLATIEKGIEDRKNPTDVRAVRLTALGSESKLHEEITNLEGLAREARKKLTETNALISQETSDDGSDPAHDGDGDEEGAELPRPR